MIILIVKQNVWIECPISCWILYQDTGPRFFFNLNKHFYVSKFVYGNCANDVVSY